MDRRRSLATLALGLVALTAAAPASPPLRELRWIAPGVSRNAVMTALAIRPAECLAPAGEGDADRIAIGRAMFAAPLLLGGQAARAGLSCAACHVGGGGNPHFAFPGVSGAPGTADVTSSLFSSRRGDGVFNPRPIPDLAADAPRISRAAGDPALAQLIRGLIVEEFDGLEPPERIVDGLATYVRALRSGCGTMARTAGTEADDAIAAIEAARTALAAGDGASARLLIGAARSALGRIDERFTDAPAITRRLAGRDAELRTLQSAAATDPVATRQQLHGWAGRWRNDVIAVKAAEPGSLYAPAVLGRHLATHVPAQPRRGEP